MIDTKDTAVCREETRFVVTHRRVPLEPADVGAAQTNRNAIDLRLRPCDRKSDRRVEKDAEVVRVIGELPEVLAVDLNIMAQALGQADVVLIAMSRFQWRLAF